MIRTYSPNETALIKILSNRKGKPITTKDIVVIHYAKRTEPEFARQGVVTVLNSLIKKVKKNKEDFVIKKTERSGPYPNQYWIENV
jgi:type IV secretory pathway protease TraF